MCDEKKSYLKIKTLKKHLSTNTWRQSLLTCPKDPINVIVHCMCLTRGCHLIACEGMKSTKAFLMKYTKTSFCEVFSVL